MWYERLCVLLMWYIFLFSRVKKNVYLYRTNEVEKREYNKVWICLEVVEEVERLGWGW
jgi:hypothetical protein